jgi:hypothetical protein
MRISNMKITPTRKELNNNKGGGGLEICIPDVKGDPTDANAVPCSIFIEEYEGDVWVRIWDGEQDPQSIKLTNGRSE